ncbi:MAG: hypothetical protein QM811_09275 [Pirellulales bacterium]
MEADALRASYRERSDDARLWLTSWPYLYLGRNAVRRRYRNSREAPSSEPPEPDSPNEDPTLPGRVLRALDAVRRVDAVGYTMVLELMRGEFEPAAWRASLGVSDATVTTEVPLHLSVLRLFLRRAARARAEATGSPRSTSVHPG